MKAINHLDLFSGVGGFSLGLREAGVKIGWHGFSDIDKHANKIFKRRFPDAEELGTVESIKPDELPRIDLITFGFPCQDLSIAGRRKGFDGSRSSLFFESIKIIEATKPQYFVFENVKGFFSSNDGKDFAIALRAVADIGYDGQWQLLNTRWFLPQNRERIYFVGHIRGECRPEVFPIGEISKQADESQSGVSRQVSSTILAGQHKISRGMTIIDTGLKQVGKIANGDAGRVFDSNGIACTLKAGGGGWGGKTGLYQIKKILDLQPEHPNNNNVYSKNGISPTIPGVAYKRGPLPCIDENEDSLITRDDNVANAINSVQKDETGDYRLDEGYRKRKDGNSPTLTAGNRANSTGSTPVPIINKIRRLTPTECERLQGFPDGWTEGQSDTQRYKQMGNAVSVPVVKSVMEKLFAKESNG